MNPPHLLLEERLTLALASGRFRRLLAFAHWCAAQTATPGMPDSWRAALNLSADRASGWLDDDTFSARAQQALAQLPVAATVIGLNHGDPAAARLLAIAGALDAGPCGAAVLASRNQRLYERLVTVRIASAGQERVGAVAVSLQRPRVLNDEGSPPSRSELRCANQQLIAWDEMDAIKG